MEYEGASQVDAGEPSGADPMMAHEMAISIDRLQSLGETLAEKRDAWVSARVSSGVEKRWLDDYDQYMGQDKVSKQVAAMMESVQEGYPVRNSNNPIPQRSTVYMNITRGKTNTAEARVANMLLPTDDRNFGLKARPTQEMTKALAMVIAQAKKSAQAEAAAKAAAQQPVQGAPAGGNAPPAGALPPPSGVSAGGAATPAGQPVGAPGAQMPPTGLVSQAQTPGGINVDQAGVDKAQVMLGAADSAAKAMQTEVDSQFQECNWNAETRMMIHDSAVLGTGVLKGPIVVNRKSKTWLPLSDGKKTIHVLEMITERAPTSYRVSPWNVYPDPACGQDHRNGSGLFECYNYSSKQVRELVKQPGFIEANIGQVLEEGPMEDPNKNMLEQRSRMHKGLDTRSFKVWEYWGQFEPEDMRAAGVDVPDDATEMISGCVIMINETVIKGFLNPLETGELPYDMYPWELDEESPWGYGVPFLCRPQQKVLNSAWRQMMDNAGLCVGPQIVLKPSIIKPADKDWKLRGPKIWNCLDESVDVRTAITAINIDSHAEELERIIKLAQEFIDDESMVPQLMQGTKEGVTPDTLGGMILLQNSNNVVLGRLVKQFDDRIITPHVGRYVDWNMAYNDKQEIKGDHHVVARGTSALLVRDIQNQNLIQFGQFQSSGVISPMVNWEGWIKAVAKSQHLDVAEILKTDAQIAALGSAPAQASDAQIRAQAMEEAAQIRAKAMVEAATIRAQAQTHQSDAKMQGEITYANTEAQVARDNHTFRLEELKLERELALLKYAHERNITLDKAKADLAKVSMVETTKRQALAMEHTTTAHQAHADRVHEQTMAQAEPQPTA